MTTMSDGLFEVTINGITKTCLLKTSSGEASLVKVRKDESIGDNCMICIIIEYIIYNAKDFY